MALFARNMGETDRKIRIVVGVVVLALTVFGPQTPWGLLGFLPLATALFRTCPLYSVLGIDTLPKGPGTPALR